ncbi:MAG TPA: hypothetical protein VMR51_02725 [Patescibacteria group bacterium]|nr:hypothetical protein [Patescibacteria group bacterium]
MKVAILYRSQSENERLVLDFERDYKSLTGRDLSLYDLNTQDGAAMASLYDVVNYPAVLALANNGELLQLWQGEILPMLNEVMYYDQPE